MARQRTPTSKLKVIGAFDKHPERTREDDVYTGAFPTEPPEHLSEEVKSAWHEIVAVSHYGVLQASDTFIVELAAGLLAELRRDPFEMVAARLTQLRVALGALGLTPADRSRLSIPVRRGSFKPSSLLD